MSASVTDLAIAVRPMDGATTRPINIFTLLTAARCWWHIALPVGLLLALAAATIMYYVTPPTYTAQAWLYIREQRPILVTNAIQEDPRKFRFNQIELMKSPPILGPVTSNPLVVNT